MAEIEQSITDKFSSHFKAGVQKQPFLVLVGGFQGSGKTSLIKRIQDIYDVNVISTDAIRQSLFDRGLKSSPEFSQSVKNVSNHLLKIALSNNSNIVIDANAHAKRIDEVEKLLKEERTPHSIIRIFLNASEEILKDRVRNRKPLEGVYQGSESDLEGSLATIKINLKDYDLIIDSGEMNENEVFDAANKLIYSIREKYL